LKSSKHTKDAPVVPQDNARGLGFPWMDVRQRVWRADELEFGTGRGVRKKRVVGDFQHNLALG
jgi:hypothetical protein